MGQQQSSEKPSGHKHSTPSSEKDRKVNRRVSLQALSHAQPVDPSASNANAVAQATTSHNVEKHNLQQMLQSSSPEYASKPGRVERSASRASRDKKEVRDMETKAIPIRQPPMSVPEVAETMPQATVPSESIAIPPASSASANASRHYLEDPEVDSRPPYEARSYAPVSHLRPPRLPLPIADAPTPDSPTLAPVDVSNNDVPIFDTDEPSSGLDSAARRRSSFQSEATQDDEEVAEELQPYAVVQPVHTVPTTIEWNQPGERVFVTGTFATWDRKYRLHRRKSGDGMSCVISLPPGTHHLKFWVDNQMLTSDNLPTAVDFNNVLVNYIEISADDIPRPRRESTAPTTARTGPTTYDPSQPPEDSNVSYPAGDDAEGPDEPVAEEMPPGDFRAIVPQYLHDIDYADDDHRYQRAVSVIQDSTAPPSLPMFLNKSLLNGNLPVKDDHSVLTLPNHTVLNHLMTSSVKNGVLATSVTTRYKSKYVTTISFKPVPKFDRR